MQNIWTTIVQATNALCELIIVSVCPLFSMVRITFIRFSHLIITCHISLHGVVATFLYAWMDFADWYVLLGIHNEMITLWRFCHWYWQYDFNRNVPFLNLCQQKMAKVCKYVIHDDQFGWYHEALSTVRTFKSFWQNSKSISECIILWTRWRCLFSFIEISFQKTLTFQSQK